jgi:SAM-dependent methyltransferase
MLAVSGSTKRPERPAPKPDPSDESEAGGRPASAEASAEPDSRAAPRSPLERIAGPIDLRSRAAAASHSGSRAGLSGSASATGPFPTGTHWSRLVDSLIGDVLLSHVPGCRVLDLGYGSPEIAGWVKERIGDHLSIVEKGALEQMPGPVPNTSGFLPASEFLDAEGNLVLTEDDPDAPNSSLAEYRDASFDVVYAIRTFPHLGYDTASSELLGRQLLREAARVTVDGGTVFIQIANPRSLRGFIEGIRNPITVVSRRRMILGDRYGLTRWDTLGRFLKFLPPELEFVRVHGLGVSIPHNATLQIPIIGRILARIEWRLRDMGVIRRFGAQLLVVLRRLHRSDPSLRADGPQRSTLSSTLLDALSSGSRSIGIGRAASSSATLKLGRSEPPEPESEPEPDRDPEQA